MEFMLFIATDPSPDPQGETRGMIEAWVEGRRAARHPRKQGGPASSNEGCDHRALARSPSSS